VPQIVILIIYLLTTGLALNPLPFHFDRALPGDGQRPDYAIFVWDLWWMRHALVEMQVDPFKTDFIIYPFTHSLVLHTFVPFWGLFSIPLQSFMKIGWILNTFVVMSFLLTGYFTALFAHRHGSSWSLSLLAGALMAFTPPMISRTVQTHLNMLAMWWIPLSLLAFDLVCHSRRLSSALLLAFCLYAALLTDLQYMMWVPMVLVPYALSQLLSPTFRLDRSHLYSLLTRLSLAVLVFGCLASLYPVRQLLQLDTSGYPQATLKTPHYYSLPISAFFRHGEGDRTIGLLIVPVTIVVWVLDKARKRNGLWLAIAAFSLLLALGPFLSLEPYSEARHIPMPYLVIHKLLRGQYRCPVRFAVLAVFGLSIFIALKGQAIFDHFRLAHQLCLGLVSGILLLVILDYGLLCPFPIFFPKEYAVYQEIAKDPRDVVLLEVPLGVDTEYTLYGHGQQLIAYQPIHRKRIPNGALSRMPLTAIDYFRSFNLLDAMAGKTELGPAAADELARLIGQWNIGYVLIHRSLLSQEELQQLLPFFATQPSLCFWQVEGDLLAYRTRPAGGCPSLNGTVRVNFGSPEDAAYVGTGWYLPENIGGVTGRWAGGVSTATLRFDLSPQLYQIRFRAWAYPPGQVVTLRANGVEIATLPMPEAWTVYTATIPAAVIRTGESTQIQFDHAVLVSPHERTQGESPDQRALGAAYEWVVIKP
jgi:hypothetical protein